MAVTLKQLARELGLNDSTVSYALSGKGSINEATRQRVRDAAERLGYVPNALARRVRTQRTGCLGLVFPDSILQYNEIIQQLYRAAAEKEYELQIALTEYNEVSEERAIKAMMESRVDGVLMRSRYGTWDAVPANSSLRRSAEGGAPIVSFGWNMTGSPFSCLELPLAARSRRLTSYLIEQGHRNFACLLPTDLPIYGPYISTIDGGLRALEEAGLSPGRMQVVVLENTATVDKAVVAHSDYGNYLNEILPAYALGRGRQLLASALELSPRPTALICYNEVVAIGALAAARELGIDIPGELAIGATHRSLVADLSPLSLTTCDVAPRDAATAALQLLLDVIEGRVGAPECRTMEPLLLTGASTTLDGPPGLLLQPGFRQASHCS